MIRKDGKVVNGIHQVGRTATAMYKAVGTVAVLVWTSIRSCFGNGYWVSEKPWLSNDAWKE